MSNRVMMITGMHRSGTSLISQWLYRCGLDLGNKLVTADSGNEDGHFEDSEFVELHSRLLKKRKLSKWGFVEKQIYHFNSHESAAVESLVRRKNTEHEQWGWKDPRTALFLPLYEKVLPGANTLVIVRGYKSSVNSLLLRDYKMQEESYKRKTGLSKLKWNLFKRIPVEEHFRRKAERYLQTWICYHEQILDHIHRRPPGRTLLVHYDDLVKYDDLYFNYLRSTWQMEIEFVPFKTIFKPSLLSEVQDITPYIGNKWLLQKAAALNQQFKILKDDSLAMIGSGMPVKPCLR
jgi:hypothetical protein